jgi:hypothetical protein
MLVWLAVLCSLVGRRVIWDPHDFFHEGFETGPLRWAVVKRVMERLLAVRDVPMLAVSEGMAAIYRSLYPRARIELVRNYAVEPRLTLHPRRPTADAAVLKVVYPGLLAPDRIPVEFIRAVGRQSGIQLDILGSDRWSGYGAGIRELIRAEHIGNVRLMGEYGSSGLLGTLSQYDWAVLPYVINHRNVDHCLPNKFFQCINAGLPLLVSSMTELGGLVAGHGLGHVFKDGDYTTAVALLQMYSPDSGEYEALRQRVFDYAAQQVDYEAQRMLLLSLYESVAAAPLSAGSTRPSLNP